MRTKKIVGMVANEIRKLDAGIDPETSAQRLLENAGLKIKSLEKGTDALFFLSVAQAKALAKLATEDPETTKEKPSKEAREKAQNALKQSPSIDVALFGRMVADDPSLNTDACAQVAHSISTHKVSNECDYFTAVDDLSEEDNAGAGHIGTVEFNSSTLYRYATVAVHELYKQLGDDTIVLEMLDKLQRKHNIDGEIRSPVILAVQLGKRHFIYVAEYVLIIQGRPGILQSFLNSFVHLAIAGEQLPL